MPEPGVKIIGVDFSGGGDEDLVDKTWLAEGKTDGYSLTLDEPRAISRKELTDTLKASDFAVAAMDFPFGVPEPFIKFWGKSNDKVASAKTMPATWAAAWGTQYDKFRELRDSFVQRHGEMMRNGDAHFGGPLSPLKTGGPNMLPMTFRGMQMLHCLWESQNPRFRVPPMDCPNRSGPTLLEVMPGVLLRTFCLPATNYKRPNKTNHRDPKKERRKILAGLERLPGLFLKIPFPHRDKCVQYDDGLDSLVAAIGAAMWVLYKPQFLQPRETIPPNGELQAAQLEGWIYAPVFIRH